MPNENGLGRDAHRVTAGSRNEAHSLRIRRVWYADDAPPPTEPAADSFEAKMKGLPAEHQALFNDMLTELKAVRGEAAERRRALKAVEEAEAKRELERKAAADKALQEQGEFKKLYEQQTADMAQMAAFKERAEALETLLKKQLETRMKTLPPHYAELVAKLSVPEAMAWLDANADKLTTPNAPNLDGAVRGTRTLLPTDKAAVLGHRKIGL